jgi:sulfide dehydrogenase cytochrome subunit
MTRATLASTLTLLALASGAALADGVSPVMLAYTCAGCHGTDGSSVGPSSPHIAALNKEYFIDSMKQYKEDKRNSTIMNRIAKGYTDEQIEGMADFFENQALRLSPQEHDATLAENGAKLHDQYCEKCHEGGGKDPSDSGTLAGQWMPYLHVSMADYQAGAREMPKKMKTKVQELAKKEGDGALEAIIQYYGSVK